MPHALSLAPNRTDPNCWLNVWEGLTVFVIKATEEPLDDVLRYALFYRCPVIAVEDAVFRSKWADTLFVSGRSWWQQHKHEARRFRGPVITASNIADPRGVFFRNRRYQLYEDPGVSAISCASFLGAKHILLVGFDAVPEIPCAATLSLFHSNLLPEHDSSEAGEEPAPQPAGGRRKTHPGKGLIGWKNEWRGKTVFVLASGPSLTQPDVDAVRDYRQCYGCPVVVTNTTFKLAPWADLLFFYDRKWWQVHGDEVTKTFGGLCVTVSQTKGPGVLSLQGMGFNAYRNSGGGAISFAMEAGAKRIVLVGLDGKYAADGRRHWHVQHPMLGDATSLPRFIKHFPALAADASKRGVQILNASRDTGLTCFTRVCLDNVLSSAPQPY